MVREIQFWYTPFHFPVISSRSKKINIVQTIIILFQEDVGRVYYLKEKRLSQFLISVLGLENSSRLETLLNWNDTSDLSSVIYDLISNSVTSKNLIHFINLINFPRNTF